jgi:hypothetical protein
MSPFPRPDDFVGLKVAKVNKPRYRQYLGVALNSRNRPGQIRSTSVCPVIPAEPVPDPDPGAGIHRSQGPNCLSIALHGDWIPVSQPE